jgi:hypothetical protein
MHPIPEQIIVIVAVIDCKSYGDPVVAAVTAQAPASCGNPEPKYLDSGGPDAHHGSE